MKYLAALILFFNLSTIQAEQIEYLEPKVTSLQNVNPERILFVGNSYLYYNDSLHNHLRRMVEEKRPDRKEYFGYKSCLLYTSPSPRD